MKINIDGREAVAYEGETILSAAKRIGIEIPTMCFHESVKLYGACGICVVEAEGMPKLLRACSTMVSPGMVISTDSPRVMASRKTALELLLSDHEGDCRPPCVLACPAGTDCQGYVGLIANGLFNEAATLIREQLPLPASIGRVCPHPCEEACRRQLVEEPINIAMLKAFAGDTDLLNNPTTPRCAPSTGKRAAIIGGGPAGLTTAYFLSLQGVAVTIYDKMPQMGGMLRYGIPEYRLPKSVVDAEVAFIENCGVRMKNNIKIGRDLALEKLRLENDAVVLAIGAWTSLKMNVPGEELDGVIGGIDFLQKAALNEPVFLGKKVAVCGGGNTAMDACRTAVRLGASEVYIVYRRTKDEMPAEAIEIKEAEEEGVIFKYLTNPIEIQQKDGRVSALRLQIMALGEPDESGRRRPVPVDGAQETLEVDTVIMAIGQGTAPEGLEDIQLTRKGTIEANQTTFLTNLEGVFAVGDATNKGAGIAIEAIGEGKKASTVIESYLNGKLLPIHKKIVVERDTVTPEEFADKERIHRVPEKHLSPDDRKYHFNEIRSGYSPEEAVKEASRCLECGCADYFECSLLRLANDYEAKPQTLKGEINDKPKDGTHPFITRNQNKCILCGLCVRVCDEVMGISAFGLADRGFDTTVVPALNKPLSEAGCIACGQCVSMCPTGALTEKQPIEKNVPLEEKKTETTCAFCSVGCTTVLTAKGNKLLRSIYPESSEQAHYLCVRGKFGFGEVNHNRIQWPMVRKNGKLERVSLQEALLTLTKKAQALAASSSAEQLYVSISDRLTLEEIYLINKYSKEVLKTTHTGCFIGNDGGLQDVLGVDASANTIQELEQTDYIILFGDIMANHTVAGIHIRNAVKNGASLTVINEKDTLAGEWADTEVNDVCPNTFLKMLCKALIEIKGEPAGVDNFEAFQALLSGISVNTQTITIAQNYADAKKAMIVFDRDAFTNETTRLVGALAVLSGHIGKPRDGIIQLRANCNSQGAALLGITGKECFEHSTSQDQAQVPNARGFIVFGEDIPHLDTNNLDLLAVFDTHFTETAEKADIIIPFNALAESDGTIVSADRSIKPVHKAISPTNGLDNWKLLIALANCVSPKFQYDSLLAIQQEIAATVPGFEKYHTTNNAVWPVNENAVLYRNGYHTHNGKAQLPEKIDSQNTPTHINTSSIYNSFMKTLSKKGL